jgi:ribosomal protein L12E/L44/L45/RPP1/RPP2
MMSTRWGIAAGLAAAVVLLGTLRAQERPGASGPKVSIQDALLRPARLPFVRPTSLDDVAAHLRQMLGAPVVLDLAALKRLEISPEATVQLDLDGVRLKTGLALLLDQVGLRFKVIAEDNLLILTDAQGADDPTARALVELKALHRDVHDLQDAVEELTDMIAPVDPAGPAVQKPRIIEELPDGPKDEKGRSRPGA